MTAAEADRTTMGRLTNVLERLWDEPRTARRDSKFKTPTYDGKSDVEYFIQQFTEVSIANEWPPEAAVLHLREALKEGARDCGRPRTTPDIFTTLRARYGLSTREALARVSNLRKDSKASLQEHATEVERLIAIAYEELPIAHQARMALNTFCSTLGNAYLQRHLLAVPMEGLADAVKAGNEFLQIGGNMHGGTAVRAVDGGEETDRVASVSPTAMETMVQLLKSLTEKIEKLQTPKPNPQRREEPKWKPGCWGCGQEGHIRANCPTHSWKPRTQGDGQEKAPGNGAGPQQ
jgi:hypothetical protein